MISTIYNLVCRKHQLRKDLHPEPRPATRFRHNLTPISHVTLPLFHQLQSLRDVAAHGA
jgi:hypothetical protein